MMKTLTLALAAASVLALSAGSAAAQTWTTMDQRLGRLDARIDAGIRTGDLTRTEAVNIRGEFRTLVDLERRYQVNGLSQWERSDLDRRFDALSSRIRYERADNQGRGNTNANGWYGGQGWNDNRGQWTGVNNRQAQLDRRIDRAVRAGRLTRSEAVRLRNEYRALARLETRYRANGLTVSERADLDRRFDILAMRVRYEANDGERYGYNR